eukprot:TRINITY_DN18218_c0_g1_i1.p1 TRINITY_DN18218_c0_g1~~TRINITY_DN18218_c0_g1_i1.p1  ORF type:complete len:1092 (+),score=182.79 TRINITY_DN18218_c0_g1_i1:67-3342(+)
MSLRLLTVLGLVVAVSGRVPIVLVSMDGFRHDYLSRVDTPAFDAMMADGAYATEGMKPAMVTKTFPNHYTIVTGLYEEAHGIVGNQMYDPDMEKPEFYMGNNAAYRDWWGGEPIWETAEKFGVKSAVYFWPGSETNKSNAPTYLKKYDGSIPYSDRREQVLSWLKEDDPPGLILLYFDEPDATGHKYSPDSSEIIQKVKDMDAQLAALRDGINATGVEVNLVIVSDHGMASTPANQTIDVTSFFDLSQYVDSGALHIGQTTPILSLYVNNSHPSAYSEILLGLTGKHPNMTVYERANIPDHWHIKGTKRIGDIIAVADEGWTIEPLGYTSDPIKGQHGFDNELVSMRALFIASGPAFIPNSTVQMINNVDVFPLLSHLLDLQGDDIPPNNGSFSSFANMIESRPESRSRVTNSTEPTRWRTATSKIVAYPPDGHEFSVFEKSPIPTFDFSIHFSLRMIRLGKFAPPLSDLVNRIEFAGETRFLNCLTEGKPKLIPSDIVNNHDGKMVGMSWTGCLIDSELVKKETKKAITIEVSLRNTNNELINTSVTWNLRHTKQDKFPYKNMNDGQAKNVILMIGDGMSVPMLTAARMITRNDLETDKFPFTGIARTHSIESVVTDSAAAATALNVGHKTINRALGVYPDNTPDPTDNPRMETLGEYCRNRLNMKVGIATTSSLVDATPAAVFSHCSDRRVASAIVDQSLEFRPDVMLGGGLDVYNQSTLSKFASYGYEVVVKQNASAVLSPLIRKNGTNTAGNQRIPSKLIGVLADHHLPTHYNRETDELKGTYPSEVNLPDMAEAALEVLTSSDEEKGFYLMVEAASIDKQAHACDSVRMLDELLELQRTITRINEILERKGIANETLFVVTSDHSTGGYDVYGTVNTRGKKTGEYAINENIRQYGSAEYPDWKADSQMRVPNELWSSAQWTLAGINVNHPAYKEDFTAKVNLPEWWIEDKKSLDTLTGIEVASNIGGTDHEEASGIAGHTGSDVLVFANGPGASRFVGSQENTRVFWNIIASLNPQASDDQAAKCSDSSSSKLSSILTAVYLVILAALVVGVWICYRKISPRKAPELLSSEMDVVEETTVLEEEEA